MQHIVNNEVVCLFYFSIVGLNPQSSMQSVGADGNFLKNLILSAISFILFKYIGYGQIQYNSRHVALMGSAAGGCGGAVPLSAPPPIHTHIHTIFVAKTFIKLTYRKLSYDEFDPLPPNHTHLFHTGCAFYFCNVAFISRMNHQKKNFIQITRMPFYLHVQQFVF